MFKNALVSVSDKTGLAEFLLPYAKKGLRIVSTGGTADYLKKSGLSVVDLKEQTGFEEVMGGRVKTLHPRIHMPLLARDDYPEDFALLKEQNLDAFDLVIVNLYPFEQTLMSSAKEKELIEKIDIGGPTLLRASAKNFSRVTVVVDPKDYAWVSEKNNITIADRKRLAAKVFAHVSRYDSLIADWFDHDDRHEKTWGGTRVCRLRYGENPQQKATWFASSAEPDGLHSAQILQGKELSYNNLLDLEAASVLVQTFQEPSAVAVKHNNPCGVASADNLSLALEKALSSDPVSVFGGIIALNREVGLKEAQLLTSIFLECVVAPSIKPEAMEVLAKKKNLRILCWPQITTFQRKDELRRIAGGILEQSSGSFSSHISNWKFLGEKPSDQILQDLIFSEKICASLKSNSIALVKNLQTIGLGMGQVNRVDAVEQALHRARQHHPEVRDLVLASDAFFPFADSIEIAARGGVRWVLQPGGSVKDSDVFLAAEKLGIQMVITGERHFKH